MFWYFLVGFISGVVGVLFMGRHISKKIERIGDNNEVR